jgi:uncharacterized Zn-finger protein
MDEPPMVTCPECDAAFYVVWNNSLETQCGPDYCPFCGEQFDYAANLESPDAT